MPFAAKDGSRVSTKEGQSQQKLSAHELLLDAVDEQQQSRLQIKMKNEAAN